MNGKHTAVTIGKFECVHRGHQRLVANITGQQANGLRSAVIAIEASNIKKVLTETEKRALLGRMGVSACVFLPMDQALMSMEPE